MQRNSAKLTVQGAWEVKRRFHVPTMAKRHDAQAISRDLGKLPGVRAVQTDLDRHRLTLVYDITHTDYRHILQALEASGFAVPETRWTRLKTNWLQGLDEIGRDNAKAPAAPCCSKGVAPMRKH